MSLSIKRLSHWSWFFLRSRGLAIHVDPAYLTSFGKPPVELREKADILLYTHDHNDHCRKDTMPKLRGPGTIIVAPPSCARKIDGGFNAVKPGDSLTFGDLAVRVVPAYNLDRPGGEKTWHKKGIGVGYVLTVAGATVYHAGDTDFIPDMKSLGNIDVALLPVGGTFTMGPEEAVQATLAIKPGLVIPMHSRDVDLQEFKKMVEASSSDVKVVLVSPGETLSIP